jgi:hydroxymethylpyrimidine pyrophosphatase-like HAD family hydrolase
VRSGAIDDPIICANGAYLYESPTGSLWRELRIPIVVAGKICQVADENGWELSTSIGQTTYFKQHEHFTLDRILVYYEGVTKRKYTDAIGKVTLVSQSDKTQGASCKLQLLKVLLKTVR